MEKKKHGSTTALGIVMITVGSLGSLLWIIMLLLLGAFSGGPPDFERSFSVPVEMACGVASAVFSLMTGIMAVRKKGSAPGKAGIALAVVTALLWLPGIVFLARMVLFAWAVIALLLGFAPPVLYLARFFVGDKKKGDPL